MRFNYPIKYAAIPVYERLGHPSYDNEIVCYIVSKVYVKQEIENYEFDGTSKKAYKVIPLYIQDGDEWVFNSDCSDAECISVDEVFDSFEGAKQNKTTKNQKIRDEKLLDETTVSGDEILQEFHETIRYYSQVEKSIESFTNALQTNNLSKKQNILYLQNNIITRMDCSLYFAIKTFSDENFIVYSLSNADFTELEGLSTKSVNFEPYGITPLLINNAQLGVIKIISPDVSAMYLKNGILVTKLDESFVKPSDYKIIYTLETSSDIRGSYPSEENQKILLKRR